MMCGRTVDKSMGYLDNSLDMQEQIGFENHLARCRKCRNVFELIKANYNVTANPLHNTDNLKSIVMGNIDRTRYSTYMFRRRNMKLAIVAVTAVICISFAFLTQSFLMTSNHSEIGKYASIDGSSKYIEDSSKYNEAAQKEAVSSQAIEKMQFILMNSQKQSQQSSQETSFLSEEDKLYYKFKSQIDLQLYHMKEGEAKKLVFEDNGKKLNVYVGKGKKLNPVIYKLQDSVKPYVHRSIYLKQIDSPLEQRIDEGYFAADITRLPEGFYCRDTMFSFEKLSFVTYGRDDSYDTVFVFYNNDQIFLNREYDIVEEISTDNYRTVYAEMVRNGSRYGHVHIYLGEDKKTKVLTVASELTDTVDKQTLIDMALSLKFYNEQDNIPGKLSETFSGYGFTDMKGPIDPEKFKELNSRFKAKENIERFEIADGLFFNARPAYSTVYNIEYSGSDYDYVKQFCDYPLYFNTKLYENMKLVKTVIGGQLDYPYKSVRYVISPDSENETRTSLTPDQITVIAETFFRNQRSVLFDDLLMTYLRWLADETEGIVTRNPEFLVDKDGNGYLALDLTDGKYNGKVYGRQYMTQIQIDGTVIHYLISVPSELLHDMTDEEFIEDLELIQ